MKEKFWRKLNKFALQLNPPQLREQLDWVDQMNYNSLFTYLIAGLIVSGILLIAQLIGMPGPDYMHMIESTGLYAISLIFFFAAHEDILKFPAASLYIWAAISFLWFLFVTSAFDGTEVDFIVPILLVVFPIMIMDVPMHVDVMIALVLLAELIIDFQCKEPEVINQDMLLSVGAGVIGAIINYRKVNHTLENVNDRNSARTGARHDALTGLLNRGGGDQLIRDAVKAHQTGAFILMDVDDFKHVNDNYGHAKGDETLVAVADVLRKNFRTLNDEDIVMRMGGDEFIIYALTMADFKNVEKKLEKVKQDMHTIVLDSHGVDTVSVSIGCVINLGSYPSYESMYAAADSLLYRTKKNGKDDFNITDMDYRPTV